MVACLSTACDADDGNIDPIKIPTSDWQGGAGGGAEIAGRLMVEGGTCPYITTDSGPQSVIWPRGFELRRTGDNEFELIDGSGVIIALNGQQIRAGGSYIAVSDEDCFPSKESAVIESEIIVD